MRHVDWKCAVVLGAVLGLLVSVGASGQEPLKLFVATNGNDGWSGTVAEPNDDKTDGPLATIAGAQQALRAMRVEGKLPAPIFVSVRGGAHFITEPIVFTPEDSGAAATPITYEAFPNEMPVIHGGRVIQGWKQEGALWVAEIPGVRDGTWNFSALWVNGKRCTPARTPNPTHEVGDYPKEGDLFLTERPVMEKDPSTGKEDRSATRFHYRPGDLKAWDTLQDAIVVVFHSWETAVLRPKSIDEENRIIEFTGPTAWGFGRWRPDQRYYVEHLFEALDQPGEWFLSRTEGKLYYMPRPGEDMTTATAVAPVVKQLVSIQGKPAEGDFVSHLTFRGLRFHFTEYTIEPQGHSDSQAAFSVNAAFEATGARHCILERCEIGHTGNYGVWFRAGCQDNQLVHSEIFDLGAGGVRIGEGGNPASENEAALRNVVDNCFLHDGGRIFRGAVGVWIGRSSYNTLSHNEICDFRYTGISVGWSWGYAPSSANHNIIEYNHVHHTAKGQLSDTGAIYMLGDSPGTVVQNNIFHDVMSCPRVSGGWGIYFDEGSTDILAQNNLVYNTLTGTLHQHYGRDNRVQNNIFAYSHRGQLIRSREEAHNSFYFERNIVYFNNGQLLGSNWGNGNFEIDGNCYWDAGEDEMDFSGRTLEEWQAAGHDEHSIVADPLFVNPEAADFRLKPGSPALNLGFQPFDLSVVGLYGEPEWVDKPKQIPREPFAPPPLPEPTTISDGFEETPIDSTARGAHANEEGDGRIRVTDEIAASGNQSLKFTDAPGLKNAFDPHLFYTPHLRKGTVVGRFALRTEPGAVFYHEWRDSHSPYRVGPSIWINREGSLTARGRPLLQIPHGQWVRFEIACALGKDADGTYGLVVTLPEQDPQRFENLPCGTNAFRKLDWYGFVSNAQESTTFYLDDVSVKAE